jgi:hypothetical protein
MAESQQPDRRQSLYTQEFPRKHGESIFDFGDIVGVQVREPVRGTKSGMPRTSPRSVRGSSVLSRTTPPMPSGVRRDAALRVQGVARSVISNLVRIIARLLVVQALSSIFGGGSAPTPLVGAANAPFPI